MSALMQEMVRKEDLMLTETNVQHFQKMLRKTTGFRGG